MESKSGRKVKTVTQAQQIRRYNRWRRGDSRLKQPDPKALGDLLDGVADRLEALEVMRSEVERCYQMLLTEPNGLRALTRAEDILLAALAGHQVRTPG